MFLLSVCPRRRRGRRREETVQTNPPRSSKRTLHSGCLKKNEKYEADNDDVGCLDFSIAINAQDWDDGEIARTLKLALDREEGDSATVRATFSNFGRAEDILWSLTRVDGHWLVSDVSYADGQWKLGTMCDDL